MRVATTCDHCGQTDDHPKVHIGAITKHHDCLSVQEKTQVTESSAVAAQIIEECEGGKRGDDLLNRIQALHSKKGAK